MDKPRQERPESKATEHDGQREHALLVGTLIKDLSQKEGASNVIRKFGYTAGGMTAIVRGFDSAFCGRLPSIPPQSFYGLLRALRMLGCLLVIPSGTPSLAKPPAAAWVVFGCSDQRATGLIKALRDLEGLRLVPVGLRLHLLTVNEPSEIPPLHAVLEDMVERLIVERISDDGKANAGEK